jgi:O-6-methylguanine DNA methyltransferase
LEAVPVRAGGTAFQRAVWDVLRAIAPGETLTYAELAAAAGRPGAARAAGGACGANPAALFVPCHRVVAAHGLGGFGWGLGVKSALLAREAAAQAPTNP